MKTCCIKECFKQVAAYGFCVNHWRMMQKHGSPVTQRPLSSLMRGKSTEERFWYSVEKLEGGCWQWKASKNRDGYGVFKGEIGGVLYRLAHRFSWALTTGEVLSSNILLLHSCDNPSCMNPDHLRTGTTQDNTADMVRKGRQASGLRHARPNVKFTEHQVRAICADDRPYQKICEEHGCSLQTVIEMKDRKTWKHLENVDVVRRKRGSGGESRSKNLKDQDVRDIRLSSETNAVLSRKYLVSQQTICGIRKNRSWKHLL